MSQQDTLQQEARQQFLELYQEYRYQNQLDYYARRVKEFTNAQRQAVWLSIGLIFLTALAGAFEGVTGSWVKSALLLIAAICPILSTALAGYTALRGFSQQAKLYRDAHRNLVHLRVPEIAAQASRETERAIVEEYVNKVENVLQTEHGFWGQLAEGMAPPGVG